MFLVFAALSAAITIGIVVLTWFANGMSDTPDVSISIWPTVLIGGSITLALVGVHYIGV